VEDVARVISALWVMSQLRSGVGKVGLLTFAEFNVKTCIFGTINFKDVFESRVVN